MIRKIITRKKGKAMKKRTNNPSKSIFKGHHESRNVFKGKYSYNKCFN